MKRTYYCTAEHTSGASVDHPCTTGIYSDPTDVFDEQVEAENQEAAHEEAMRRLEEIVDGRDPCRCQRKLEPGSNSWWDSICISCSRIPYPDFLDDDGVLVIGGRMIDSDSEEYAEKLRELGEEELLAALL